MKKNEMISENSKLQVAYEMRVCVIYDASTLFICLNTPDRNRP